MPVFISLIYSTNKTKTMKKFINSNGKGKQDARKEMVKYAVNSEVKSGTILSLPFETWAIERMILKKSKRYNFVGVELNEDVFRKVVINSVKHKIPVKGLYNGTLAEQIFSSESNQYAHIFADYCGQIQTHATELEFVLTNDLVKVGGTIAVTVNKRISGNFEFYEEMEKYSPLTDETKRCENGIRTFFNLVGGKRYRIEKLMTYKDTASMVLIIVKRLK